MAFDAATYEIDPLTLTTPRARLEYLSGFLRRLPPERFHLGSCSVPKSAHDCGTPACIAGFAHAVWKLTPRCFDRLGPELFGISEDAAHELFFPNTYDTCGLHYGEIRPHHAAAVLDHLIRTGEVDWSVARKAQSNG